ncbi:MAG: AtpZ/AtpI family protein [Minisyncoccia bacterium]
MEEEKQNLNNSGPASWGKGPWWKPAFEIFSEISTWIAVPIILAVIGGKALDIRYGTKPWIFIGCVVISFAISSFGLVRSVKKYAERIKKDEKASPVGSGPKEEENKTDK